MAVRASDEAGTLQRLAPLSGVGYAVLSVVAGVLWSDLAFLDPARDLADAYADDPGMVLGGSQLLVLAAFLLVWFAGSVRQAILRAEGVESRLASTAFGGGVAAAALLLAGAVTHAAGALRADEDGEIAPEVAASLSDLATVLVVGAAPVAMAVLVAATAVASLRTRAILPTWLAWLSVVLAVALVILPINWVACLGFLLWAVVVGILLYARGGGIAATTRA